MLIAQSLIEYLPSLRRFFVLLTGSSSAADAYVRRYIEGLIRNSDGAHSMLPGPMSLSQLPSMVMACRRLRGLLAASSRQGPGSRQSTELIVEVISCCNLRRIGRRPAEAFAGQLAPNGTNADPKRREKHQHHA